MTYNSETEAAIISAATEVFLEKGKDGARMQEIADRAGLNKALLHYYFRSKNRLYEEVFNKQVDHFIDALFRQEIATDDIREMLKTFINNYLEFISRKPELPRFIIWEIGEGGHLFGKALAAKFEAIGYDGIPLIKILQKSMNEGQIRKVDPLHLTLSLLGVLVYPFLARPVLEQLQPGLDIASVEFLSRRKDEVFDLLWSGLKPEVNK